MKSLFVHDHKFTSINGRYYSDGKLTNNTWLRYLSFSDNIKVIGRVKEVTSIPNNLNETTLNNVEFFCINEIKKTDRINTKRVDLIILNQIVDSDIVICRLPSFLGSRAYSLAMKLKKKVIVELVGCPYDALKTHGSFIGKILAPIERFKTKKQVLNANSVIYVTQEFLQRRYPTKGKSIGVSNVELFNHTYMCDSIAKPKVIKFIGSLNSLYKGLDDLLSAIYLLKLDGINLELHVLGGGNISNYTNKIKMYDIESQVVFFKPISGGYGVIEWLTNGNIYIQPSHTEGLPRALIEAMSVGLPCIGTFVGGIPELLDENVLCKAKSPKDLVDKIKILLSDDDFRIKQGIRNKEVSNNYLYDSLFSRRYEFLNSII
ncbi:hypothetical protein UA38_12775 [Photobacterium kishitanii]|nr:glycosyltransferase [Photobacterium kishitanii]KJG56847.1 hypothetical protein UA38_12775 [Photobacterium kishitanii]KJG64696.1 hypothetical protein UA40_15310 [Photobacterium kishitanii]